MRADKMPGFLLHRIDHNGRKDAVVGIHQYVSRKPSNGGAGLWGGNQHVKPVYEIHEIVDGLEFAYREWGRPDVWRVARKWLVDEGLIDP